MFLIQIEILVIVILHDSPFLFDILKGNIARTQPPQKLSTTKGVMKCGEVET